MSQIIKTTCDRCQKEITHINRGEVNLSQCCLATKTLLLVVGHYDLCWNCYKELATWINPHLKIEEVDK